MSEFAIGLTQAVGLRGPGRFHLKQLKLTCQVQVSTLIKQDPMDDAPYRSD